MKTTETTDQNKSTALSSIKSAEKDEDIIKTLTGGESLKEIRKERKQTPTKEPTKQKKEEKTKVVVGNIPDNIKFSEDTIIMEFTPEMAEGLTEGILNAIHYLNPKKFGEPEKRHTDMLKTPMYTVVQRWIPRIDMLKYLPEITLATGFMCVLKDMNQKTKEEKKEETKT